MHSLRDKFRLLTATVVLVVLVILVPAAADAEIWGSTKSRTYHLASCRYVKKTQKGYRIQFPTTATAREAGYKPCEVCRPPRTSSPRLPSDKGRPPSPAATAGR